MQAWIRRPQEDEFDRWTKQPQASYWRLIGEGGGGKTSLLARFFEEAEERRFPAVFLEANRCLDRGERDGVTLLLNLETVNTPTFDSARRLLLGVKTAFQAALDEAGGQTKANWDRISELAECGAEGAGAILKGARDVAKVLDVIFGKGREASRAQDLAQPEQFLLKALADDMAKGGVWLIDTWEQADAKPFTTRLEFPAVGRLRTPLRGKPTETTLAPWLDGVFAWMFGKAKLLALIAGREAPSTLGDRRPPVRGVTERTQPWNETEIAAFLADALPEIDHGDAPLSDLRRRTGGVPLLVDWVARLVGDVAREQGGDWRWAEWPRLVRDFAENDRYGLIHYAVERVVKQSARIADVWKLALVDELTPAVADILFPPAGRDGPTGRDLLRELGRLGLARPVRGQPDRWLVHDVTRSALESYAAYEEKLGGPETLETHRALADHYDREAGWTKREEAEYWRIKSKGKVPRNWGAASIANRQFATVLRAAFHRSIVALHGNAELCDGKVKPGFIYETARRLTATITFSPPWVRAVAGLQLGSLSRDRIERLLDVLRDEGGLEGGFKPEDAHLFHRMSTARSMSDLDDVDFDGLIEKYRNSTGALGLIAGDENISNEVRWQTYLTLMENHPQNPKYVRSYGNFCYRNLEKFDLAEELLRKAVEMSPEMSNCLGDLALFLKNIRKDYDEAEGYYRLAVEADPRDARNLGNFAWFLTTIRKDHDEAERYYRRAVEADPHHANNLGNFANFLTTIRKDHDEAERYYRRAVEADLHHANNLGNFANFLTTIRKDHDEAERYYRRAVEADPHHANNLGNFANFLTTIRKDHDEAERYYRRAVEADPHHANNLGNFAWFLRNIRKDYDEAEGYYRLAVEADPRDARNLGNFAWFLTTIRKDHDEAERYYRRAVEADPRDANNLGNFALFLTTIRKDHDEAEGYYRLAVEADPHHANNLGNFALFLKNIRKDHDEAERYYRLAVEADPHHANNLSNFAIFLASIRGAYDEAEQYYRLAVEADSNHANSLGNLAGLLFARDSVEEAETVWRSALALADTEPPALSLELWFYAYAHLPHRRDEALREVTARLERGERSPNFDLSRNVEAARRQGHPAPDLVADLARRIGE